MAAGMSWMTTFFYIKTNRGNVWMVCSGAWRRCLVSVAVKFESMVWAVPVWLSVSGSLSEPQPPMRAKPMSRSGQPTCHYCCAPAGQEDTAKSASAKLYVFARANAHLVCQIRKQWASSNLWFVPQSLGFQSASWLLHFSRLHIIQ